jgi:uncharacterized protein YjiS (DUF1127 family)
MTSRTPITHTANNTAPAAPATIDLKQRLDRLLDAVNSFFDRLSQLLTWQQPRKNRSLTVKYMSDRQLADIGLRRADIHISNEKSYHWHINWRN